jgi:ankyrin repeat protein
MKFQNLKRNETRFILVTCSEITTMLLEWKPDLANEKDASGSSPMHYVASSGDETVVKNILDKAPLSVYIQDQEGLSPLHVAAKMGHQSVLCCMIEHCPDSFELRDNHGRNFLHFIEINLSNPVQKKLYSIIKLVSRSPDLKKLVNERDNEGNTPLHCASLYGLSDTILNFLRASKADSTLMNYAGKTALDHAVSLSSFFLMVESICARILLIT